MKVGMTTPMGAALVGATAAVVAIVVLVLAGDGRPTEAQVAERPNFVFVLTDDLDERSMQDLGGIRSVMASNGATFDKAYYPYALCCPSRATFLRGQYPHNHQIIGNGLPTGGEEKFRSLGLDKSTIATWLDGAGYRTKYIGKYMNNYYGSYVPPGWDEWYALKGEPTNGKINRDGQEVLISYANSTDVFAGQADDFIRRSSAGTAPFFVTVGVTAPHHPPAVPARHQDSFSTTPLPKPPNFDEADVSDKPQWVRSRARLTQGRIDAMQSIYRQRLRSMLSVEDLLRRVVATLRETGELDNTYVIFTSDNGYHFGNHRLDVNKATPYEEDIGMPLMVRGPGVPAEARRQQLVLNNDVAPTLADLAGAPTPAFVDGRSFAPLLSATPPSSWRTAFLEEGWREGYPHFPVPTHKSVHTQRYMFTEYDTGERELYDLAADPYQLNSRPRAGNEQTYTNLGNRLAKLRACAGLACRTAEGP